MIVTRRGLLAAMGLSIAVAACDRAPDIGRAYSQGYYWGEMECKGEPAPMVMEKEYDDSMKSGEMAQAYKQGWRAGREARGCR